MDIAERIEAALDLCVRRSADKARDLKLASRHQQPEQRIRALETQLLALLEPQSTQLLSELLTARAGAAEAAQDVLDTHQQRLFAAFDRLVRNWLAIPEQRLGKLPASALPDLQASRQRLKKAARLAREQLAERWHRHLATSRKANEVRREAVRARVAVEQAAERRIRQRARRLWLATLTLLVAAASVLWWRR